MARQSSRRTIQELVSEACRRFGVRDLVSTGQGEARVKARRWVIEHAHDSGYSVEEIAKTIDLWPAEVRQVLGLEQPTDEDPESDETASAQPRRETRMQAIEGERRECEHDAECLRELTHECYPKAPRKASCRPNCPEFTPRRASWPGDQGLGVWDESRMPAAFAPSISPAAYSVPDSRPEEDGEPVGEETAAFTLFGGRQPKFKPAPRPSLDTLLRELDAFLADVPEQTRRHLDVEKLRAMLRERHARQHANTPPAKHRSAIRAKVTPETDRVATLLSAPQPPKRERRVSGSSTEYSFVSPVRRGPGEETLESASFGEPKPRETKEPAGPAEDPNAALREGRRRPRKSGVNLIGGADEVPADEDVPSSKTG